ncbi:MAG: hypothetical protein COU81_03660 [Candidatus Portnoybacteria bacterium CG10_big_fil_rev_8_21_14_0_10_36_7]|uniref:Uncharacterized protein n=1 Tax=Candidatus Portnoybacteria bacterium CG10_big_fil_rev_8_21_14_0_10_36_7 TaxID=1974812 RepID=A0A2M8KD78_9BACT|nr:MAG: hypothetical protein COU81_03660 [Candidatus Portnoybacteria bacterium CG10_big_fil_rev_8_21_14_0_10_36_7]
MGRHFVSFNELSRAKVLATLYNAAGSNRLIYKYYGDEPMTEAEAEKYLAGSNNQFIDYINGRLIRVSFRGNKIMSVYGYMKISKVIKELRQSGDVNSPVIKSMSRRAKVALANKKKRTDEMAELIKSINMDFIKA